jgi:hypothetical protein
VGDSVRKNHTGKHSCGGTANLRLSRLYVEPYK